VEAKKELEQRREQKRQSQIEEFQIRDQAAKEVQRIIRGHFARRSYQKSSAHHERDDTFNRKGKFPKKTVGTMNVKRKRQKSICYVPSTTTSIIDKERGEKENKDKKNYY
jgi:hypothetical protein